jgi:hypothetical protein
MLLTKGQMSDCKGAALMSEAMPPAPILLADHGCDADWFRQAFGARHRCLHPLTQRPQGTDPA